MCNIYFYYIYTVCVRACVCVCVWVRFFAGFSSSVILCAIVNILNLYLIFILIWYAIILFILELLCDGVKLLTCLFTVIYYKLFFYKLLTILIYLFDRNTLILYLTLTIVAYILIN